ncbi:zinc-finger of the MIZ type in Nse subunit-domain-containing protein [Syncephalastrum racemosum]|uniref:Zinc-finger of the MIZ type in Nse subunit-domain-containing protein n=1 Tax=Syncephalastrum racemosum TaxID=13706 RepID=A0A1X2H741_SYNRA|nr:zinc-finger of the MIZ type in Nse subunit-domain-containing protein [Syncephalastrum racemosum]
MDDAIDPNAPSLDEQLENIRFEPHVADRIGVSFNDFETVRDFLKIGWDQAMDVACDLETLNKTELISEIETSLTHLVDYQALLHDQKTIMTDLATRIRHQQPVNNLPAQYDQKWEQARRVYEAKSAKTKYYSNPQFVEFKQAVWDIKHPDEPMPALGSDDEDDDLVVGRTKQSYICPITQLTLEEPYMGSVCRHHYSKEAIHALIRRNHGRVECPVSGCRQRLSMSAADLVPDVMLARKLARMAAMAETQDTSGYHDID